VVPLANHSPVGGVSGVGYADNFGNGNLHDSACHSSVEKLGGI
jgi:hypothetical protein